MKVLIKLYVPESSARAIENEHRTIETLFRQALYVSGCEKLDLDLVVIPTKSQCVIIEVCGSVAIFLTNGVVDAIRKVWNTATDIAKAGGERKTLVMFTNTAFA